MAERTSQRLASRHHALDARGFAAQLETRHRESVRSSFEKLQHTFEADTREFPADETPEEGRDLDRLTFSPPGIAMGAKA